jgi:hypothetical protein
LQLSWDLPSPRFVKTFNCDKVTEKVRQNAPLGEAVGGLSILSYSIRVHRFGDF